MVSNIFNIQAKNHHFVQKQGNLLHFRQGLTFMPMPAAVAS